MFSQTSKISRLIQTEQRAAAEANKRIKLLLHREVSSCVEMHCTKEYTFRWLLQPTSQSQTDHHLLSWLPPSHQYTFSTASPLNDEPTSPWKQNLFSCCQSTACPQDVAWPPGVAWAACHSSMCPLLTRGQSHSTLHSPCAWSLHAAVTPAIESRFQLSLISIQVPDTSQSSAVEATSDSCHGAANDQLKYNLVTCLCHNKYVWTWSNK